MEYVPDISSAISKFPNIHQFDAGWVGIKEVSRRDMTPMKDFTWVSFWGNKLEEVPANTFTDLTKMWKLILGNNNLKKLHPDTFSRNVKLRELWLQNNMLEALPRGLFRNNKELSHIYANSNKLVSIKIDFNALPQFEIITLTDNVCIDLNCDTGDYCGTGSKAAMQQKILLEC
jgi:Leucine-rich repeat (LRR) protein